MRRWIISAAALLLAGCSEVVSVEPVIDSADAAGAPTLRDGLWRVQDPDCTYRDNVSVGLWPRCAAWVQVRGRQVLLYNPGRLPVWEVTDVLLIGAEPTLIQAAPAGDRQAYIFGGLRVAEAGEDGAAIAIQVWPALCGPRQRPSSERLPAKGGTFGLRAELFPGLLAGESPFDCRAPSFEPLRAATKASEAISAPITLKWVRAEVR